MKRLYIALLLLAIAYMAGKAQQEVLYTQYVYNELTINPAYAGYHDNLNITLNSRKQWLGLEGSPMTMTLAGHKTLKVKGPECKNFVIQDGRVKSNRMQNRVGLGVLLYNDKIGVDNTLQGSFAYSYKIVFKESRLSFGLQASVLNYSQNFINLEGYNNEDPLFAENTQHTMVNFGTGVFFDSHRYYVGLSVPQIIKNYLDPVKIENNRQLRQYFLTGGYLFFLNNYHKVKPSFMMRYTEEVPFQLDLNVMVTYYDKIYYGVSYRNKNTVSAIFQLYFAKQIRIGMAYDYVLSDFKKATSGTVEVMLNYNFRNQDHKVVDPRYF